MSTAPDTGHGPPETPHASRGRLSPGLIATVLAAGAIVGAWVYVLFIYDPGLKFDEMEDRSFPIAAEEVCAATRAQLEALPLASQAASAEERADVVEVSNTLLLQMVDELRPIAPTSPANVRDGVQEWLDDWIVYIGDRQQYVDNLRADAGARFLETTKGVQPRGITRAINGFAEVNRMESCATPGDLS